MNNHEVPPIRRSVKLVLLNSRDELLLMYTDDSSIRSPDGAYQGAFWQLVGGKIERGESLEAAAARELFEETGLTAEDVALGPALWQGDLVLAMHGVATSIQQTFLLARTSRESVTLDHLTQEEQGVVKRLQWFSLSALRACRDVIYPGTLLHYLPDVIQGCLPPAPIPIDLVKPADP